MSQPTDAELLASCDAQPRAFAVLVERHHHVLHRYAARRLGAVEADDVVAETFLTAYRRRRDFDPGRADARPWLFGIATNLVRRRARREARMLRAFARTGIDPLASPAEHDGTGAAVAAALAALRKEHRDVLFLHAVCDLSHDEIAEALRVPVGTVKGWLYRARETAARELAERGVLPNSTTRALEGSPR
jgi:RNA polymerase sigma factor (sigma-70 family)